MPRLAALISVLFLALPGAAFAQGAGDDQYQDPFGDEPAQTDSGSGSSGSGSGSGASDDGLSDAPPTTSPAPSTSTPAPSTATPAPSTSAATTAGADGQLPNTGSDPRLLMLLGAAFVLCGAGLRLRTIDPDAF